MGVLQVLTESQVLVVSIIRQEVIRQLFVLSSTCLCSNHKVIVPECESGKEGESHFTERL